MHRRNTALASAQKNSASPAKDVKVVAAVDLGSNSFHMIVARLENGSLRVVDRLRETVRLAEGLENNHGLSAEVQIRALDCLRRFGQRLHDLDSADVRAVGTNTFRAADDVAGFLAEAEQALGHPIDIISGIEEARLIYLGVARSLGNDVERCLAVDIGGGSTEIIIGDQHEALHMNSFYMGCVSMTRQYFANGRLTEKAMSKAETAVEQELEPVVNRYLSTRWDTTLGASGTIRAAARIAHQCGWCEEEGVITRQALKELKKAMLAAGHLDKLDLDGLSDSRKPVLPGGVAILRAIFDALQIDTMRVADGALREGLLFDLVGRIRHEDVRDRSVLTLVKRCAVDEAQAGRVRASALEILGMVSVEWELEGEEPALMLGWAAQLHECGLMVTYSQYHKHGEYIIRNVNLPGFSQQEKQLLADLVRAHRRKFPLAVIKALPDRWLQMAIRLAIILRLAVALNRGRADAQLPSLSVHGSKKRIVLELPPAWLDQHPLTKADLQSEADYLSAISYKLVFK
ncbi:MAG: exopolyphosphatase [Gammaproteobacteria bacterium]